MTHATITPHTSTLCAIEFAYNVRVKDAVKELPGSTYDGTTWHVAIMHLPTLKGIFDTLTVEPEVVANYHALIKRMLCDFVGSEHRKGELGKHIAEIKATHANGIAAVLSTGWQPTQPVRPRHAVAVEPIAGPVEAKDAGLATWLTGVKNAKKAEETKAHVVKAARRRRVKRDVVIEGSDQ